MLRRGGEEGVLLDGSAVRQDGRSASLTAPNGSAQRVLLLTTLCSATIAPSEVACVEAHGTGTALGDPTEAGALSAVHDARSAPLAACAAKASVGHSEAASGQVGLLKVQGGLRGRRGLGQPAAACGSTRLIHERLGTVSCHRLSLPTQGVGGLMRQPEQRVDGGVSSFGYSGTIAHAVLSDEGIAQRTDLPWLLLVYNRRIFQWRDVPHPFAQRRLPSSDGGPTVFRSPSAGTLFALVADHVVQARIVFPGAGYLEMARAAAAEATLQGVFFLQPLAIDSVTLLIECAVSDSRFEVRSGVDDAALADAAAHCSGSIGVGSWQRVDHASVRARSSAHAAQVSALYASFDAGGLQYGPAYRTIVQAWAGDGDAQARLRARVASEGTAVHPADLDDALCVGALIGRSNRGEANVQTRLPYALDDVLLQEVASGELWAVRRCAFPACSRCHSTVLTRVCVCVQGASQQGGESISVRLGALASPSQAQLDGFKSRVLRPAGTEPQRRWLYVIEWSHMHDEAALTAPANCLEALVFDEMSGEAANALPGHILQSDTSPDVVLQPGQWLAFLFMISLRSIRAELPVVGAALSLLQSQAKLETPPPVWIFTRDTQHVSSLAVGGFLHTGLWGLTRTCRQESAAQQAWCMDVQGDHLQALAGVALAIQHAVLRVTGGSVYGLQVSSSMEPEAVCAAMMLHVPRLVAPHKTRPLALSVSFEGTHHALDVHTSRAEAEIDTERLAPAYDLLEMLCQQYVRDAMHLVSDAAVAVWHHKLLYAWCARQSAYESSFTPSSVRLAHPGLWPEVQLAERCGPRLADALLSTVAYQELLFPNGSMEVVLPMYEDSVISSFYNACVVVAVETVLTLLPLGQRVVALEVGAGSGGTASSVLPILDGGRDRYIFTDVSNVFLNQAKVRFGGYTLLEPALLNIDSDPRLQGFASHQCDICIATNVLHATPCMRNTLTNCRQLATHEGTLIINEGMHTSAMAQITFGMTDGWWLFSESCDAERVGQNSPLLYWRQWESLLADCDFYQTQRMHGGTFLQSQAVIVARAIEPTHPGISSPTGSGAHLLSGGLGGLGLLTARLLIEAGARQLVLSSRSDRVVSGSEADWAWLASCDGDVRRLRCDVSDGAGARIAAQTLRCGGLRLSGLFHAAHMLADAALPNQTVLKFRATYGPKVHGAMALHAVALDTPLSLFNVYSSVAGTLGSSGQASHSAANAWLDSMAGSRNRLGMAGQSVAWGAVAEIGYAARHGADKRAAASGFGAISRTVAASALSRVLEPGCRSFVVLPADWAQLLAGSGKAQGLPHALCTL